MIRHPNERSHEYSRIDDVKVEVLDDGDVYLRSDREVRLPIPNRFGHRGMTD